MEKPVRYGVIGCGGHAMDNHILPIVGKTDLLELVMLCDNNTERCGELRQQFPLVQVTDKPSDVFANSDVQAVVICTPDNTHKVLLEAAVAIGKHTLVEKPAVDEVEHLSMLSVALKAAQELNLVVTSCHPWRFHSGLNLLRNALQGNTTADGLASLLRSLGAPLEFSFNFSYHQPTGGWKTNRSLLVDHFNHEFDMLHFLFGHSPTTFYRLTDSFDRYHVIGVRDDGLHCSFHGTRRLSTRNFRNYLAIRFERGSLDFNGNTGLVRVWEHETSHEPAWVQPLGGIVYAQQAKDIMTNFAAAILGEQPSYLTAADILANTAACVSLAESNGAWRYEPSEFTL